MSMYSMVMLETPECPVLLYMLGFLEYSELPRVRDAWLTGDGRQIVVLTRAGGANREHHVNQITKMRNNEHYVGDKDDDFDNTYAEFTFNTPEHMRNAASIFAGLLKSIGFEDKHRGIRGFMLAVKGEFDIKIEDTPIDIRTELQKAYTTLVGFAEAA